MVYCTQECQKGHWNAHKPGELWLMLCPVRLIVDGRSVPAAEANQGYGSYFPKRQADPPRRVYGCRGFFGWHIFH